MDTLENKATLNSPALLADACREKRILEARALVCDSEHNMIVDLKSMRGIIPREEGAIGIREGTVRDIAIISRVNRPVSFVIQDFIRDPQGKITALLSRREAQERCRRDYTDALRVGDVIDAKITHIEPFGVFVDIGCGLISLLPIDAISVSRIEHPHERFSVGMNLRAVIKSTENGRITLSQKELLGTWTENAALFHAGETVAGIVRSVENYGIFVELAPNLAGLAELKENVSPGQQASVYIKCMIPARMKIKLIIIETFEYNYKPAEPTYFFTGTHMDRFLYSPPESEKVIVSDFLSL